MRYRKDYEVTGRTTPDGDTLCPSCWVHMGKEREDVSDSSDAIWELDGTAWDEDCGVIFLTTEWSDQPVCERCLTPIECQVIEEGR